ncbi:DUF1727 domain-containing protein, partial [Patescibacteria group bacterium]|nr:DUF1727 domain-containing protein [Patescibacteria group bacterium]
MTKPPSLALTAATIAGKICSLTVRSLGSGGEALPGLVAKRIDSTALRSFGRQCKDGIVLVCGTNGKTTVSRLIADFLTESGQPIVHNRSGSNMTRGHLAAFLEQADWLGRVHADLAILEVDEAVLPETLSQISPRIVLLHNLFRDQLDRYGEVDTIRRNWEAALRRHLAADAILTVNADDPNLAYLASQLDHRQTIYYGIDDQSLLTSNPDSAVDAYLSPVSGKPLQYTGYFYSHLGIYADPD